MKLSKLYLPNFAIIYWSTFNTRVINKKTKDLKVFENKLFFKPKLYQTSEKLKLTVHKTLRSTHTSAPTAWRTCRHRKLGWRRIAAAAASSARPASTRCQPELVWLSHGTDPSRPHRPEMDPCLRTRRLRNFTTWAVSTVGGRREMWGYRISLSVCFIHFLFVWFFIMCESLHFLLCVIVRPPELFNLNTQYLLFWTVFILETWNILTGWIT